MPKRSWILLPIIVLLSILLLPNPIPAATAQTIPTQPIYYMRDGDIWRYEPNTGNLVQETFWGYNDYPQLSYDGTYFAYNSIASGVVENLGAQSDDAGDTFSNIWLARANNTDDSDYTRIANQHTTFVAPSSTTAGAGIIRSTPSWSTNSLQLTWLELDTVAGQTRLVVYDANTGGTRTIAAGLSLGFQDVILILPDPIFGPGIIAHTYFNGPNPNSAIAGFTQVVEFYDANTGALLSTYTTSAELAAIQDIVWLVDMPNSVAFLRAGPDFETYNVFTQSSFTVQNSALIGALSWNALTNNNANLRVQYAASQRQFNWTGAIGQGRQVTFSTRSVDRAVALSPNGDGFAYIDPDTGSLWVSQNGVYAPVPNSAPATGPGFARYGPIWAPTVNHINNEVGTHDTIPCPSVPQPRLTANQQARVIPNVGGGNAFRGAPGTGPGSAELLVIPENGIVTVVSGPYCASGFYWYLVNYNGQLGYTAEASQLGTYWLEPLS